MCELEEIVNWQPATEKKWIPDDAKATSFFGKFDLWFYRAVEDDVTCKKCIILDATLFTGYGLRGAFPYLEIQDDDTIFPYTHPNCRCVLMRSTNLADYLIIPTEDKYP